MRWDDGSNNDQQEGQTHGHRDSHGRGVIVHIPELCQETGEEQKRVLLAPAPAILQEESLRFGALPKLAERRNVSGKCG